MKRLDEFITYLAFSKVTLIDECIEDMARAGSFIYNIDMGYILEKVNEYHDKMVTKV